MRFNGIPVIRSADKQTLFIPLPREAWTRIPEGCGCEHCRIPDPSSPRGYRAGPAWWDTVGAGTNLQGTDTTWNVHFPELHPQEVRDAMKILARFDR